MSARPVLVIHGVGQRSNEAGFTDLVGRLQDRMDPARRSLRLVPVFWGDLAGNPDHIHASLPVIGRDGLLAAPPLDPLAILLTPDGVRGVVDLADSIDVVVDRAVATTLGAEVRGDTVDRDEVRRAVAAAWPDMPTLQLVSDRQVLESVGDLLAEGLTPRPDPGVGGGLGGDLGMGPGPGAGGDQGGVAVADVRGPISDVAAAVRRQLEKIDALVDHVIGNVGGQLNQVVRRQLGEKFVGFFGDIIAYSQRRAEIHDRIRERVAAEADGHGTASQPIGVVAHSLGGVAMFDLAVAAQDPLHVSTLVTFGSQAPFFHAMARRSPVVDEYTGTAVTLPPTIRRWLNLWEPLDPLAFVAARMFVMSDGTSPEDRDVPFDRSGGLWTHSTYWNRLELDATVLEAFV